MKQYISTPTGSALLVVSLLISLFLIFSSANQSDVPISYQTIIPHTQLAQISGSGSGLVAHYAFDEGSGTTAGDSAGSNTGTLVNGPTWVAGKVGSGALDFDGVNDRIMTGSDFIGTDAGTYSAWIKARSEGDTLNLLGFIINNGASLQFGLGLCAAKTIGFTANNATNVVCGARGAIEYNTWYLVTATRDATGVANIYVNGVLSGTANQNSGTPQVGNQNVQIGDSVFSSRSWDGSLDDVRIYNRVLTLSEIGELYALGGAIPPPDPGDTTAPVITVSPTASSLTTAGATITWSTDEGATSQVQYGLTSSYTSNTTETSSYVTSHSVTLSGLTANTTYHYRVISKDATGNTVNSSDGTFTTSAVGSSQTTHYIRAGATGNNDGSDWNNAWTSFGSVTWTRGHTYYVAGGTYTGNVTILKPENGSQWIYVKKAISTDHGSEIGWQSSYGSGTAEILGKLEIDNSYVEIDGQVGSDDSGHGFKISLQGVGGNVVFIDFNKDHIHLYHIEMKGSGSAGTVPYGSSVENGLYMNGDNAARTDIHIAHSWIHGVNRDGVDIGSMTGLIFEHNRVERIGGHADDDAHGQGLDFVVYSTHINPTIRYNKFIDIIGSAYIAFLGGTTGTNVKIYGNIFWATDRDVYNASPGVIWTREGAGVSTVTINGLYVYNNTFHNLKLAQIANDAVISSNAYVRNNIWEDSLFTGTGAVHRGVTVDHNYYYNNIGTPPIGPTDKVGLSSAFVNALGRDYSITIGSLAKDSGVDLGSEYNLDYARNSRPQGSGWDIGAYEYCEGNCATVTPPLDSDLDLIPDTSDLCPLTPVAMRTFVNTYGCPKPKATTFTIKPDFDSLDLRNVTNLELGTTQGRIIFLDPVVLLKDRTTYKDQLDLDANITITNNRVVINSTNAPELNKRATITLSNLTFTNPKIMKDGITCTTCTIYSYSNGTLIFTVPNFSTYEAAEVTAGQDTTPIAPLGSVAPGSTSGGALITNSTVTTPCTPSTITPSSYTFTTSLTTGAKAESVKQLQIFLNSRGFTVSSTGGGSRGNETTYFGPATTRALAQFQAANNITPAVGFFGPITRAKVNSLNISAGSTTPSTCITPPPPSPVLPASSSFTRTLSLGMSGNDVKALQIYLNTHGHVINATDAGSPGNETTYFGPATKAALIRFQEANRATILTPNGLSSGTGIFGPSTRAYISFGR